MQTLKTRYGRRYIVYTKEDCTVCEENGPVLCRVAAGDTAEFIGFGIPVQVSSDTAEVRDAFSLSRDSVAGGGVADMPVRPLPENFLRANVVYDMGALTENTDLSHLSFEPANSVRSCEVWLSTGESVPSIIWPSGIWVDSADGNAPDFESNSHYRLVFRQEGVGNLVISVAYVYSV